MEDTRTCSQPPALVPNTPGTMRRHHLCRFDALYFLVPSFESLCEIPQEEIYQHATYPVHFVGCLAPTSIGGVITSLQIDYFDHRVPNPLDSNYTRCPQAKLFPTPRLKHPAFSEHLEERRRIGEDL